MMLEQNATEEKRSRIRRYWKQIALSTILLSILLFSLILYVLPTVLHPLRIDEVPAGAYVVPWMRPNPSIEALRTAANPWSLEAAMGGALQIDMTFRIVCQYGTMNETRVVPSTVYLGHDMDYLYVGGTFRGMYTNPANDANVTLPNYLSIFLDVANDGKLTFPESGSDVDVILRNGTWRTSGWWRDWVWMDYEKHYGRAGWVFADYYYDPRAMPAYAVDLGAAWYDNSTGTVTMVFSRHLRLPETSDSNTLQMRRGERWVMGFVLELGLATWYGVWSDFVDGWPQKTYPYLSNDSSWWPKLAIDLSNPPTQYPGGPTTPLTPLANLETPNKQPLLQPVTATMKNPKETGLR